jgi:hypothetical protein
MVTNDFTMLQGIPLIIQIKELFTACCVFYSKSNIIDGIINDEALEDANDILSLELYTKIKSINYYTLVAYDERTNLLSPPINVLQTLSSYAKKVQNYKAIVRLRTQIELMEQLSNRQIELNLIGLPNKYNPIEKFKNPLYTELVPLIHFEEDFNGLFSFTGYFQNNDVRYILSLFGFYETLYNLGVSEKAVNKITKRLPKKYKQVLNRCLEIYFPSDFVSVIGQLLI